MEYRAGKCSQCGAEYQIPASFAHNVARCKKCKGGVVHVSAAARGPGAAASPTPQAQARPAATVPDAARVAALPATDVAGRRDGDGSERLGEAVAKRARPSSALAPAPASGGGPGERPAAPAREASARQPERRRSPRTAIVGLGLLLLAALLCAWFFYFRTPS
jgi:hypothetical protein